MPCSYTLVYISRTLLVNFGRVEHEGTGLVALIQYRTNI